MTIYAFWNRSVVCNFEFSLLFFKNISYVMDFVTLDFFDFMTLTKIVFSQNEWDIKKKRSLIRRRDGRVIQKNIFNSKSLISFFKISWKVKMTSILFSICEHQFNLQLYNSEKLRNSVVLNLRKNEISTSSTMKLSGKKMTDDLTKLYWQTLLPYDLYQVFSRICLTISTEMDSSIRTRCIKAKTL